MESSRTSPPSGSERRRKASLPADADIQPRSGLRTARKAPFLRLLAFYTIVVGIAAALFYYVPWLREAWLGEASVDIDKGANILETQRIAPMPPDQRMWQRSVVMVLITMSALVLSLPIAWIYTYTRRLRYDPSLVHSVIILPMVVAGIVVVVKDSVALAFSLAGIVAAVRFRNTLKDPKDAVYIFLTLGIGLAAGVQAVDIALVMSIMFNTVVLILWKWNLGSAYSGDQSRDLLAIGNSALFIARSAGQRDAIRWRMAREAKDMDTDGILLIHTEDPEAAKQAIELSLNKTAEAYLISENFRQRDGLSTFAVLIQLDSKKGDPLAILGDIDERWHEDIIAAEYIPYKHIAEEVDNGEEA